MFKVNNKAPEGHRQDVVLVFLLLTLKISGTFFLVLLLRTLKQ